MKSQQILAFILNIAESTWQTEQDLQGVWLSHSLAAWVRDNVLFIILSGMRRALKLLTGAAVNPQSPQFPKQVINWKVIYNNC